jgi:hypothetical protein
VSGPLDALLQHLVPTAEYYPDRTYIFAFLLSSRLYIKPHALLAQVVRLCMLQQNLADQKLTKVRSLVDLCVWREGGSQFETSTQLP